MAKIIRKHGTEKFDEKKVYGSVYAACSSAHCEECECEDTAEAVTEKVKKYIKGKKEVKSLKIREVVKKELKKKKKGKELVIYYEENLPDLEEL
ncbi:MAG: hypothetical protein GOV15_02110 [Candidatus Diapherotrites archaeon]|nr:hypothetical protein [Candidatus Diapherotrites archaeon]